MFFLNSFRIVLLITIGHYLSPDIALNGFHSVAGWLNLIIILSLSIFILNKFSFFINQSHNLIISRVNISIFNERSLLLPLVILITSSLLTKAFTADFQWLYPISIGITTFSLIFFNKYLKKIVIIPSYASIFMGIIIFIVWIYLIPPNQDLNRDFLDKIQIAPIGVQLLWLFFRIIGASMIVPIVEELAFRGYLLPNLQNWFESNVAESISARFSTNQIHSFSVILSLTITSILFGLLHSEVLAGCIAGLGYGLIYLYRRKLIDSICAHSITNALLVLDVIYFGNWSYW